MHGCPWPLRTVTVSLLEAYLLFMATQRTYRGFSLLVVDGCFFLYCLDKMATEIPDHPYLPTAQA